MVSCLKLLGVAISIDSIWLWVKENLSDIFIMYRNEQECGLVQVECRVLMSFSIVEVTILSCTWEFLSPLLSNRRSKKNLL